MVLCKLDTVLGMLFKEQQSDIVFITFSDEESHHGGTED
jgi:hypothetical protein